MDLIEVDVRLSRDGVPGDLPRRKARTNDQGPGYARRLDAFRVEAALDAGSWKGSGFAGERIPTLDEALRAVKGRARLLLDVPVNHIGSRIRAALTAAGVPVHEAVLGTWSPEQRAEFRREMPSATIFLSEGVPETWNTEFFQYHRARGVNAFEIANWSPAFIKDARAERLSRVCLYCQRSAPTMRALIAAGVRMDETDLPRLAIAVAKKSGARF